MRITASGISLNVDDPPASAEFVKRHFGFEEEMAADGFVSLAHPNAGFNLIYLRVGLPTFKPPAIAGRRADGLLVVFVVEDVDAEYERLIEEGVEVVTPLETEEWGERFFQVTDPCGVVYQIVTWMRSTAEPKPEPDDDRNGLA
jgi:catechol 2,3-dioxygenase-like lactoylglutathione lyase family enzyme